MTVDVIAEARTKLAALRDGITDHAWFYNRPADTIKYVANVHPADAALIVATAGNPALLDAIDEMLARHQQDRALDCRAEAERIASAIIGEGDHAAG